MKTNLKFFLILLFIGYIMEGRYSTFLHWRMIKRKKICLLTILSVHLRYASGSNKAGSVARSLQQLFAPAPAPPLPAPGECIKAAGRGDTSPSHGSPAPGCAAPAANQRRTTSPSDQWAAGDVIIWVASSETVGIASSGSGSGAWDWPQSAHGGKLPTYTII